MNTASSFIRSISWSNLRVEGSRHSTICGWMTAWRTCGVEPSSRNTSDTNSEGCEELPARDDTDGGQIIVSFDPNSETDIFLISILLEIQSNAHK